MDSLKPLVGKMVLVVTLEGRSLVGTLKGFDSVCNLVLENAFERTFHLDKGMQLEPMGLYLVRGDSLCAAGAPGAPVRRAGLPPHPPPHTHAHIRDPSLFCRRAQRHAGRGGRRAGRVHRLGRRARRAAWRHRPQQRRWAIV